MSELIGDFGQKRFCKASGKVCLTKREAGEQLGSMKKHLTTSYVGKSNNKPKRSYYCKDCGSYHVTHLGQKQKAKKPLKIVNKYYDELDYDFD